MVSSAVHSLCRVCFSQQTKSTECKSSIGHLVHVDPRWDLVYIIIQSIGIYIAKLLSRSFPQDPSSEPGKIKHICESNSASHVLEPFSAVFSPVFVVDAQACLSFLATETQRDWNGQPTYTSCRRNLLFSQFDYMVGVGPKDQGLWISPYSFNMAKPQQNMFPLAATSRLPHSLNSPRQTDETQYRNVKGPNDQKQHTASAESPLRLWQVHDFCHGILNLQSLHVGHVLHVLKFRNFHQNYQIHPKTFWNAWAWGWHPFPRILKPSKLHIHKRAAWDRAQNEAKWQRRNRIWYVCITLCKGISLCLFSWVMLCLTLNLTPPYRLKQLIKTDFTKTLIYIPSSRGGPLFVLWLQMKAGCPWLRFCSAWNFGCSGPGSGLSLLCFQIAFTRVFQNNQ